MLAILDRVGSKIAPIAPIEICLTISRAILGVILGAISVRARVALVWPLHGNQRA